MSLSEEDRNLLVNLQREKAEAFLSQAYFMCQNKFWDMAANRFYYAMFHLVCALFIKNGIKSKRHSALISQFHLNFVKEHKVSVEMGGFLSKMEQMREKADYNCFYGVNEQDITEIIPYVEQFFKEVKELL